jgi:hypothetical protein
VQRSEGLKIVAVLQAAYPQWRPALETEEFWVTGLRDLGYEETDKALRRIIYRGEGDFAPSLGRVRAEVARINNPGLRFSAEEAWAEVCTAVRRVGRYRFPNFSHVALTKTVAAIGWLVLCNAPDGDSTLRAQFFRIYEVYRVRAQEDEVLPPELRLSRPAPPPFPEIPSKSKAPPRGPLTGEMNRIMLGLLEGADAPES